MPPGSVEWRRRRRVKLEAPLLVRRLGAGGPESFQQQTTKDVSLAGVYFEVEGEPPFAVHEVMISSVSIPESHRRDFPFTRLAGRSRVVRVTALLQQEPEGSKRFGVALEFDDDVTALMSLPARG